MGLPVSAAAIGKRSSDLAPAWPQAVPSIFVVVCSSCTRTFSAFPGGATGTDPRP